MIFQKSYCERGEDRNTPISGPRGQVGNVGAYRRDAYKNVDVIYNLLVEVPLLTFFKTIIFNIVNMISPFWYFQLLSM